jgi:hypothetical protein
MALSWSNTFGLDRDLLAAALNILHENPVLNNQSLAQKMGVGGRKGIGYSGWLLYTGLMSGRPREVSEIGKLIYKFDPYLEDLTTLGVLHYNLCTNPSASVWNLLSMQFIPQEYSFSRSQAMDFCVASGLGKTGTMDKHLTSDVGIFLRAYTGTEGFLGLNYLKEQNDGNYQRGNIASNISPFLIAYVIYSQNYRGFQTSTISIGRLLSDDGNVGKVFLIGRDGLIDILRQLEFLGFVRVSQEAALDNVTYTYRGNPLEILRMYYEKGRKNA